MMSPSIHSVYDDQLEAASFAVRAVANFITTTIATPHKSSVTSDTCSPYPLLKFAAQILLISLLRFIYPSDAFVAEIGDSFLRLNPRKAADVMALFKILNKDHRLFKSSNDMVGILELGRGNISSKTSNRVWVLNPVDDILAAVNGGEFTVSASLFVDGKNTLAVIACPRTDVGFPVATDEMPILYAVKGQGAFIQILSPECKAREVNPVAVSRTHNKFGQLSWPMTTTGPLARVCTNEDIHLDVARRLDCWLKTPCGTPVLRYVAVATGSVDSTFHVPPSLHEHFNVWDHAAGSLIVEEAGGKVTDAYGDVLDFTISRKLSKNFGLAAAARGNAHWRLLDAIAGRGGKRRSDSSASSSHGTSDVSSMLSNSRRASTASIWTNSSMS